MLQMTELMNKVLDYFEEPGEIYYPVITGDAESLILYLEKGYEASLPPKEYR